MNLLSRFTYRKIVILSLSFFILPAIIIISYLYSDFSENNNLKVRSEAIKLAEKISLKTELYFQTLKTISLNPLLKKTNFSAKIQKNKDILISLVSVKDVLGASYIYIMNNKGKVIVCTKSSSGKTLTGNNYAFRPYFKEALKGKAFIYLAVGVTTGKRGIYFSYPVYLKDQKEPSGVIVLKKNLQDFDKLMSSLGKDKIAALVSREGIILSSNKKDWILKSIKQLSPQKQNELIKNKQFAGKKIEALSYHFTDKILTIGDQKYIQAREQFSFRNWDLYLFDRIYYKSFFQKSFLVLLFTFLLALALFFYLRSIQKEKFFQRKAKSDIQKIRELSVAIEQSNASIVITDVKGNIEFVNSAFTLRSGYSKLEALGNNPRVLKSGFHKKEFYKNLWATISSGKAWKGDIKNKAKDGHFYWESVSINPIKDEKGRIVKYIAVKDDITEKKKIETELKEAMEFAERANKAKSVFLANMSHELRTPLNSILGFSQLLEMDFGANLTEKQEKFISLILKSGEHLLEMINSILDLSKIEAGRLELSPSYFDFSATLKNLLLSISPLIQKKNLILEQEINLENSRVFADDVKLKQVLYNLFANAIKFTPEGGKLGIKVSAAGNTLVILIWDRGIGISAENQKKLFHAFEQLGQQQTEGTGLGLVISKRLIELHKGSISVKSTEGVGTEFKIVLPNCVHVNIDKDNKISSTEKDNHETEKSDAKKNKSILIVDDKINNLTLMKEMLNGLGYESDTAENGEKAVKLFKEKFYDIIFMDISMPGIDGVETKNQIKKLAESLPSTKEVFFIALTAYAMKEDKQKYLDLGFNEYISKPVKINTIREIMNKIS